VKQEATSAVLTPPQEKITDDILTIES